MGYKQHNSPFNSYRNPRGTTNNVNAVPTITQGLVVPDEVTAEGDKEHNETSNQAGNASILDQEDPVTTASQNIDMNASMGTRTGRLQKKIADPNTTPSQRGRAKQKLMRTQARHERQEKKWDLKNKLTEEKLAKSNPEALERIEDKATKRRFRAFRRDKIDPNVKVETRGIDDSWNSKPRGAVVGEFGSAQLPDFEVVSGEENSNSGLIGALQNAAKYQMNQGPNMKQINTRGHGFPMVNPDGEDPTAIPVNRAGGPTERNVLTQPESSVQPQFQSAQSAQQNDMMSNIASNQGELNTDDNAQNNIAQAQDNLGTDAATNTPPNTMGGAGMGMYGPAKKDWIQEGKESGGIKEGGLHRSLGIPEDQKIPYEDKVEASQSSNPKIRKQGKLALTFAKLSKKRKK